MKRFAIPVTTALRAFDVVFLPWMRRRIAGIHISGLPDAPAGNRPMFLVSNHVSWWDGFLLHAVHRAMRPHAPLYTIMLESELRRFPFLRSLGCIGIDPASASSVGRALRTLRDCLAQRPDSMVMYFPQGTIRPSHARPLGFQRGIELFCRFVPSADVLPVGIHFEPLNTPAPHVFLSAGSVIPARDVSSADLERAVEHELDSILEFVAREGENAAAAWPESRAFPASWNGEVINRSRLSRA